MKSDAKTVSQALGRGTVHPFPARMAPGIALDILKKRGRRLRVLDPMVGSGTVLAVARSNGHKGIGFDIDPLAVLISRVWTTAIDGTQVRHKAAEVLDRAKKNLDRMSLREAYPPQADRETRAFVRYWFDASARKQLTALALAVSRVRSAAIRNVLWCAYSRLIIAKQAGASLALDLAHSRPHRSFTKAPIEPFEKFLNAVNQVVENCISQDAGGRGPSPSIRGGDARKLPLRAGSIDLVLTSPPYLNAIDYFRCSKFSLIWMGYSIGSLRTLRGQSVGSEVGSDSAKGIAKAIIGDMKLKGRLAPRHLGVLARYIEDMHAALLEVSRVLSPRGRAIYVVGENTVRGTFVRNSIIISKVALRVGLKLKKSQSRTLPANRRYLPPPISGPEAASLDTRMRREVILSFNKVAA